MAVKLGCHSYVNVDIHGTATFKVFPDILGNVAKFIGLSLKSFKLFNFLAKESSKKPAPSEYR